MRVMNYPFLRILKVYISKGSTLLALIRKEKLLYLEKTMKTSITIEKRAKI